MARASAAASWRAQCSGDQLKPYRCRRASVGRHASAASTTADEGKGYCLLVCWLLGVTMALSKLLRDLVAHVRSKLRTCKPCGWADCEAGGNVGWHIHHTPAMTLTGTLLIGEPSVTSQHTRGSTQTLKLHLGCQLHQGGMPGPLENHHRHQVQVLHLPRLHLYRVS